MPGASRLTRVFYSRPTLKVAQDLLGKYLIFQGKIGKIVETEGYLGPEDLASHARFASRKRNQIMFGPAGIAYVYLTYGIHHMLNIVAEEEDTPGAVLIRALEPVTKIQSLTSGPGKLTKELGITLAQNGADLTKNNNFYLEDRSEEMVEIIATTRVGVEYSGEYGDKPWRYYLKGNLYVSRK